MTTFDKRENAEEAVFASRETTEFDVRARRDRFIGHWAAGLLGLEGDEAKAYAKNLVNVDLEKHSDVAVIARLESDFAAKGVVVSHDSIVKMLAEKADEARSQLLASK